MTKPWKYFYLGLALAITTLVSGILSIPDSKLHLIACDVGQGDAILAVYKNTQILVDGGPDKKVLDCLGKYMPFWDRKLEVVLLTHPQEDHYGGLIEVFRSYSVDTFIASGVDSSNQGYQVLINEVGGSGARVVNPNEDTSIRVGLLYLDIVWPSRAKISEASTSGDGNVLGSYTSNEDPNTFSIIAKLRLGNFDALLTGDIGPETIPEVLAGGEVTDVEYIKVPHHGSKNGLTREFLQASMPEVAVISVGAKNRYGHPSNEVISLLKESSVRILRTDEEGDVEVTTDGETWRISN